MFFHNIEIPENLVRASYEGSLVIFAGAGVSMQEPVGLPNFEKLIKIIKDRCDPGNYKREKRKDESPEQYLGYLENCGLDIRSACTSAADPKGLFAELHTNICRLLLANGQLHLVTTNFDNCFELALEVLHQKPKTHSAPALPIGSKFNSLVHLHGKKDEPESMVLTAKDYGEAYVTNGWASKFMVDLFSKNTVLFIGYSCEDSLVDYLTRSISSEITGRAYTLCRQKDGAGDWSQRGVEPILFDEFEDLPVIFDQWAHYLEISSTERVKTIHEICTMGCVQKDQEEFLLASLCWPNAEDRLVFTKEFCRVSNSIDHLKLLENNNLIEFLTEKQPHQEKTELLTWAISKFSIDELDAFQFICSPYQYFLTPIFYSKIFRELCRNDIPDSIIGAWLPWLESADFACKRACVSQLLEIAKTGESHDIALSAITIFFERIFGERSINLQPFKQRSNNHYFQKT